MPHHRCGPSPGGGRSPTDPTAPITTLKTAWRTVRKLAGVTGRWHDARHTLITELSESGAGDQTIMEIAGHVSRQMLSRYSHIRMEAKRRALESIVVKPTEARAAVSAAPHIRSPIGDGFGDSLYKIHYTRADEVGSSTEIGPQVIERIGSSGRTRTYNPSVNRIAHPIAKQRT